MFKVEVLMNGRKHFVEKTCSEFYALHNKLKICIKTPEIPSKRVRTGSQNSWNDDNRFGNVFKVCLLEDEELPKLFPDFLNV